MNRHDEKKATERKTTQKQKKKEK